MTTRSKPSDWQSLDLDTAKELYDIDSLYEGGIAVIVALASPSSAKLATDLDRALRDIIGNLRVDLHFEDRPTTPQVRAALQSSPLAATRDWLKELDPDTSRVLADEAHWPVPDLQRESADVTGEMRIAALLVALEFGARCVQRAQARLQAWQIRAATAAERARRGETPAAGLDRRQWRRSKVKQPAIRTINRPIPRFCAGCADPSASRKRYRKYGSGAGGPGRIVPLKVMDKIGIFPKPQ